MRDGVDALLSCHVVGLSESTRVTGKALELARSKVAHEALLRHWERLRGWLNEDREFLLWHQRTQIHVAFEWFVTPKMHTERTGAIHMKSKSGWVSGPTPGRLAALRS